VRFGMCDVQCDICDFGREFAVDYWGDVNQIESISVDSIRPCKLGLAFTSVRIQYTERSRWLGFRNSKL
jgi:hypothetical protein